MNPLRTLIPFCALGLLGSSSAAATQVAPGLLKSLLGQAEAYARSNRFSDVDAVLAKLTALEPESRETWLACAKAANLAEKYGLAEGFARKALALTPDDVQASLELADALESAGDDSESAEILERIILGHPKEESAYPRLIEAYSSEGRYDEAARIFAKALASAPNREPSPPLYFLGGWAQLMDGEDGQARETFDRMSASLSSGSPAGYGYMAAYYGIVGMRAAARKSVEQELKLAGADGDVAASSYDRLGLLDLREDRATAAESAFRESVRRWRPGGMDWSFETAGLAFALYRQNRKAEARKVLEDADSFCAVSGCALQSRTMLLTNWAAMEAVAKNMTEAETLVARALETCEKDRAGFALRDDSCADIAARIYASLGDDVKSEALWRRIVAERAPADDQRAGMRLALVMQDLADLYRRGASGRAASLDRRAAEILKRYPHARDVDRDTLGGAISWLPRRKKR